MKTKRTKKEIIFDILQYVFCFIFILSLFWLTKTIEEYRVTWIIILVVSVVACIVFALLASSEKKKRLGGSPSANAADDIEAQKQALANYAFNKLLKRDEDYTVAAEVNGMILVKKIFKWYYYEFDQTGKLHALFLIETDKGEFAFQAEGNELVRISADLVKSLHGNPRDNTKAMQRTDDVYSKHTVFADWLDSEIKNLKEKAVAYNFNIYEDKDCFSAELVATGSYDENNEDWATDELYASRNDGKEFAFQAKDCDDALKIVEEFIKDYLQNGKHAKALKDSAAVGLGFVDGDLIVVYKKEK